MFPVIIIALVPVRLVIMKKLWNIETLRHVDQWACKEGTPEDEEDEEAREEPAREAPGEIVIADDRKAGGGGIFGGSIV